MWDYLGQPNIIAVVLPRGRQDGQSQRRGCDERNKIGPTALEDGGRG